MLNKNGTNGNMEKYEKLNYQTAEPELNEPSVEEIEIIIKGFKNFKAPGEDEINPRTTQVSRKVSFDRTIPFNKRCMEKLMHAMGLEFRNYMGNRKKKRDMKKVTNYRRISLLDTAYKVVSIAILRRIKTYAAADIVGEYQCGFKKGKSTTDHIHTLRQLMKKYYEYNKDLHMLFVNFKQAYDCINREQLWTTLRNFGIPDKLVRLVQMCNEQTYCKVRFCGELSTMFECKTGLRQGDALSPALFNLALQKVKRNISDLEEMEISHTPYLECFADDIILIGESKHDVEESARKLIKSSSKMGLVINEEKTKYMVITRNATAKGILCVNGLTFEQVEDFKYLTVNINEGNNMLNEIMMRINVANRCYFTI